jgi:hypothetical protein
VDDLLWGDGQQEERSKALSVKAGSCGCRTGWEATKRPAQLSHAMHFAASHHDTCFLQSAQGPASTMLMHCNTTG